MTNYLDSMDAILAAYDLHTAKNLQRIQRGLQPRGVFRKGTEVILHNYRHQDEQTIGCEILGLYRNLKILKIKITVSDDPKTQKLLAKADRIAKQIDRLQAKCEAFYEKVRKRQEAIEEKYATEKYGMYSDSGYVPNLEIARLCFLNFMGNEVMPDIINNYKTKRPKIEDTGDVLRYVERKWEEIGEGRGQFASDYVPENDDARALKELIDKDPQMQKYMQVSKKTFSPMREKIEQLKEQLSELEDQVIEATAEPVFDIQDVSHAYDSLFAEVTGKANAQRMIPAELKGTFGARHRSYYGQKYMIIISRAAYDIGGMNKNRDGEVRYYLNAAYDRRIPTLIQNCVMIAYLCREGDTNIKNPLGSRLIVPYLPTNKDFNEWNIDITGENRNWKIAVSDTVGGGMFDTELQKKLQDFLNRHWNDTYTGEQGSRFRRRLRDFGSKEERDLFDNYSSITTLPDEALRSS